MKKSNLGLLVVAFSVLFVGAGCSKEASDTNVSELQDSKSFSYSDSNNTYEISGLIAKDWTENKDADPRVETMFFSPEKEGDDFRENINIVRFEFADGEKEMTIDEYADSALTGSDRSPGYKLLSRTSSTISGYPAVHVVYQAYSTPGLMQFEHTFFKTDKEGYMVTFTGTPDGAVEFEQVYQDFLKSIVAK